MEVAMKYLPKGYTFSYLSSLTGWCNRPCKWIKSPKPVTRRALFV
jgi:hypothetical protein